jgi:hypothetical protein
VFVADGDCGVGMAWAGRAGFSPGGGGFGEALFLEQVGEPCEQRVAPGAGREQEAAGAARSEFLDPQPRTVGVFAVADAHGDRVGLLQAVQDGADGLFEPVRECGRHTPIS